MQLNKKVFIPKEILLNLKQRFTKFQGSKKSKAYITVSNLLKDGTITLGNIKKIKNTLNTSNDQSVNFLLGDEDFINWYEKLLDKESNRLQTSKENKERAGFNNPHRKEHEKSSFIHTESTIKRNIKIFINENIYNK